MLVATGETEELEGELDGNWIVLIEFPSETPAHEFMQDEEYVEVMSARHETSAWSDIAMVPKFSG